MNDTNNKFLKDIRNECFKKKLSMDKEMVSIIQTTEMSLDTRRDYSFLTKKVPHNISLYLIEYVLAFSKNWFGTSNVKILDWGCGKGYVSHLLKKKNINVTACDVYEQNGTTAFGQCVPLIEKSGIDVVPLKHIFTLPFENNSFDVVLSFGVLEHVLNDYESLKEIYRILKDKGLFFCFYLPYSFSYTQRISHMRGQYYHDHLYNYELVSDLLRCTNMNLLDYWHRALLPKRSLTPPFYRSVENLDNWLCNHSILKHFATNIEFVASKGKL